ncbi:TVP38/TMEM64 family protein [Cyanobacteria bacterium FACHB-472]|nr:TVP38/TMEM64 family protein [Cyanobacteria bacterium FACHB-472]
MINRSLVKLLKNPRFWMAIALLFFLLLCIFSPLKVLFDPIVLTQQIKSWGTWGIFLFLLIFTAATAVGIPGIMFPIVGGAVFGLVWGTFWSTVGATLGAIAAFWTARYLLHDWAKRRFGEHPALMRFNQAIARQPLTFVLAVRFAPISPFTVVNFLFGLTPINWVPYAVGTFLGIIPGMIAYVWVGATGESVLRGGDRFPFFLALSFLALLSFLPILARKKKP